jgi:type II secretory pathway pseudopilin PulG
MPSFRLLTVFYVFALLAAALGTFGPIGIFIAAVVLGFWAWMFYGPKKKLAPMEWVVVVLIICALGALLLPAVQSARGAAERSMCMNNLKQIQIAILNYESVNRTMPPAFVADANGKPMHSWRVLILPYLGENALYAKYNFNEPWNGPNNSKLASQMPDVYRCPSQRQPAAGPTSECNYFAVVDPTSGWPGAVGRPIKQFADGTSLTLMVIEASGVGANWMEPRDLNMDEAVKLLTTQPRSGHAHMREGLLTRTYTETSARNVARCDGSVYWMEQLNDPALAKALLTAAGNEVIPQNWSTKIVPTKTTIEVKWGVVWGLTVFVILAVLPAGWVRRTRSEHTTPPVDDEVKLVPIDAGAVADVPTVT